MSNWDLVTELLAQATEHPSEGQAHFIRSSSQPEEVRQEALELLAAWQQNPDFLDIDPAVPQQVGPWRILRPIGRGGMGCVYEAQHADPTLARRVALKLIGARRFHPGLIERFLDERAIQARLEHPGIARLYDTGSTANGLPYFVMEYIDGQTLDRWLEAKQPSLPQRLALLRQVCQAISYAHRNLIVHGDLKPGNILVDQDDQPRLLDFGIASVLSDSTPAMGPMLTPRHASPEQLAGQTLTTASDIYQAGLLLQSLLPAPSPELDAIVRRCLQPAPAERYASIDALLADMDAYLQRRPLSVIPATPAYLLRKFLQRRPLLASLAVALVLAVGTTAWQAWRAEQARQRAFHQFEEILSFSRSLLAGIRTLPTDTKKPLIQQTAVLLNGFVKPSETDPVLLLEAARAWQALGMVQGLPNAANLGDLAGATQSYNQAIALARRALPASPKEALERLCVLSAEAARVQNMKQDRSQEARLVADLESLVEALARYGPSSYVAQAYGELAWFRSRQNRPAALEAYSRAIAEFDRAPADLVDKATVLKRWGALLLAENRLEEGVQRYQQALAIERASNADPFEISFTLSDLGLAARRQGRLSEAIDLYQQVLSIREQAYQRDPANLRLLESLASAKTKLAWVYSDLGQLPQAITFARQAIALGESESQRMAGNARVQMKLAWDRLYLLNFLLRNTAPASLAELRGLLQKLQAVLKEHPSEGLSFELLPYNGLLP